MEKQSIEIGARVSAKLAKPSGLIGTNITGEITTVYNDGKVYVTDDIYEIELEVVPETIEIIKRRHTW